MKPNLNTLDKEKLEQFISAYLSHRPAFFSFIRPQEAYLFNTLISQIKSPVLDFGCGDGFFANLVFPKRFIHTGLDIENSRIYEAKKVSVYQHLKTFDGKKTPFKDNSYQTVISNSVLEHIPNLSENLAEVHRILKPRGKFITSVMSDKWEDYLPLGKIFGQKYLAHLRHKQEHYNLYSCQKWKNIFKKSGFKTISTIGYLNPRTVKYDELFHYLSFPSLLSYKLFRSWVVIPSWHQPLNLTQKISSILFTDLPSPPKESSSLFFILEKES